MVYFWSDLLLIYTFWSYFGNKKVSFVCQTKETFLRDAFLAERDAHCVRGADFVCDARLRRVCGTHRITYHSAAASLITYLQINQINDIFIESEVCMMSESKLRDLSTVFPVVIIEMVKYLKSVKESIVSKLEIALKEASETGYWLELLHRTKYIGEQSYKTLSAKYASLRVMLIASCKTAKENLQ